MGAMKVCTKCKRMLPLDDFYRNSGRKDKLRSSCKKCDKIRYVAYYATHKEQIVAVNIKYNAAHKEERNARSKKYYANNKEKIAAKNKKYRAANREKIAARNKKYQTDNPVKGAIKSRKYRATHKKQEAARIKKYRATHKEKCAASRAQWARNNPDKIVAYSVKHYALKLGATVEPLPEHYERGLYESQNGLCYYCGGDLAKTGYHRDHMTPLSRGGAHSLANLCLSCPSCNMRKWTKTAEEFFSVLQRRGVYAME